MFRDRRRNRRLLRRGPFRRRLFGDEESEKIEEKHEDSSKPESGKTYTSQSNTSYCFECIENHTMTALTEMRHAIDRYRSADKMVEGVTEKVKVALQELQGINEDIKNTDDATPEVRKGLDEILEEVRWLRKEFGISGRGLTRGYGTREDLEELRNRILVLQNKTYRLVEKCPTCTPRKTAS